MNKVEKIKDWISKTQDGLMDAQCNFGYPEHEGAYHILCNLDAYIDSLEEEPISKDLKKAAIEAFKQIVDSDKNNFLEIFKAGAQWQKQQDQSTIELAEDHAYLAGQEKIIDKACKWLENYFKGVPGGTVYLEDFKKAMEE